MLLIHFIFGLIVFNPLVFAETKEKQSYSDRAVTNSIFDDKNNMTLEFSVDSYVAVNEGCETKITNDLSDAAFNKTDEETTNASQSIEEIGPVSSSEDAFYNVYVIPIEGMISKPIHFILRRSLKEAIDNDIDVILNLTNPTSHYQTIKNTLLSPSAQDVYSTIHFFRNYYSFFRVRDNLFSTNNFVVMKFHFALSAF